MSTEKFAAAAGSAQSRRNLALTVITKTPEASELFINDAEADTDFWIEAVKASARVYDKLPEPWKKVEKIALAAVAGVGNRDTRNSYDVFHSIPRDCEGFFKIARQAVEAVPERLHTKDLKSCVTPEEYAALAVIVAQKNFSVLENIYEVRSDFAIIKAIIEATKNLKALDLVDLSQDQFRALAEESIRALITAENADAASGVECIFEDEKLFNLVVSIYLNINMCREINDYETLRVVVLNHAKSTGRIPRFVDEGKGDYADHANAADILFEEEFLSEMLEIAASLPANECDQLIEDIAESIETLLVVRKIPADSESDRDEYIDGSYVDDFVAHPRIDREKLREEVARLKAEAQPAPAAGQGVAEGAPSPAEQ